MKVLKLTAPLCLLATLIFSPAPSSAIAGGEELLRTSGVDPDSGSNLDKSQSSLSSSFPLGTELALPVGPDLASPPPAPKPEDPLSVSAPSSAPPA